MVKRIDIIKENLKNSGVGAYSKVANDIYSKKFKKGDICYVANTPQTYNYGGYQKNTMRAYTYDGKDGCDLLFYNTKIHRGEVALKNYDLYKKGKINPHIWENYITNGYNTRRGLIRSNDNLKNLERIKTIGRSHSDLLGNETHSPKLNHQMRVGMRND